MLINSLTAGVKIVLGHSTMKALQDFIVTLIFHQNAYHSDLLG